MTTPFPSLYQYAMAHACPTCMAGPGVECNAPNKTGRLDRAARLAAQLGMEIEQDPLWRLHKTRQQTGVRHKQRDIGNAPWPEDREPGKRYDTLPRETP